MRAGILTVTAFAMLSIVPVGAEADFFGKKKAVDKQRQEIIQMRDETLDRLYREVPAARDLVDRSAGYAVFSNRGINVLIVSTANGEGVAHDTRANRDIYMKMFSAGGGVGMGVKKFSAVFVFHSQDAFDQFVDKGWNFTGQVDAAATTDAEEGEQAGATEAAIGLTEGVTVYQMTEKGLALQATLQGTKYWKDDDLN